MRTPSRLLVALIVTAFMLSSCGSGSIPSTPDPTATPNTNPNTNTSVPSGTLDAKQVHILLGPIVDSSIAIFDPTDLKELEKIRAILEYKLIPG